MKRKFHEHSRSVIYSWILSYILLTLVTLVLTGFVYVIAKKTIEAEINNSNHLLLENIRDNIDASLSEVNDLSMAILSSQDLQNANNLTPGDFAFYYKLYKAAQGVNYYKIFNKPFQGYYIYLGRLNRVITPGIVSFGEQFYDTYIKSGDFSYEQWLQAMSKSYHGEFIRLPYYDSSQNKFSLALIRSFPSVSKNSVANIVIMLDSNSILDYGGEDRDLFILDGGGSVIAQSHPEASLDLMNMPEMPEDHGLFTRYSSSGKEVISYISSRQNDWKYITVTPEYVFWQKASFIRRIILIEIFICIVGMALLSSYFVRRNYDILQEITSFVRQKLRPDAAFGGNEYQFIRQALSKSIEQKEEFEYRLERQQHTLRTSLLISLLEGQELYVPIDELLATYDVQFANPYFSVVAIYIENVNTEMWTPPDNPSLDIYGPARFAVGNVMEEIIGRSHGIYLVEVRELILCIVNTEMTGNDFKASLENDLKSAKDFIAQRLDIDLCLSVGGLHTRAEDLHLAYNEARSAMDYARILGQGRTVFYTDMDDLEGKSVYYPFEMQRRLLNYIHLVDYTAASDVVENFFASDYIRHAAFQMTAGLTVFVLASNILRGVSADDAEFGRRIEENGHQIDDLLKCKTAMDMKRPLLQLVKSVIPCNIAAERSGNNHQLRDTVENIIRAQYADPSLSIGSITESIGKSPYYISKMFKIQNGNGILDFISRVRIDRAKELLQSEELTQEQIAELVGFTSVRTFQRTFKKLEGVPPGKLKHTSQ